MLGKVTIEESFTLPRLEAENLIKYSPFSQEPIEKHVQYLQDIDGDRLHQCDENGIGMQIISYTSPGPQGIGDQGRAEAFATEINDYAHKRITGFEQRLSAFATLSMHSAKQASAELRRCVTTFGFKGAMLNNFQLAGASGDDYIWYDGREFDVFWQTCTELDAPVYLHPAPPTGSHKRRWYDDRKWLMGPAPSFANDVSIHLLGMVVNGVFDRHPKLQVIVGHMGEHIVGDLWRIHHFFEKTARGKDLPCKLTLREYFHRNLWVSTSGFFSTTMLNYVIAEIGADKVLFAVDYPFERNKQGCEWFDNVELSLTDKLKIGRENAKRLFKLGSYKDSESFEGLEGLENV